MKDTFIQARLVEEDLIRLVIFSSVPFDKIEAKLVTDRTKDEKLLVSRQISTSSTMIIDYHLSSPLALGHSYALSMASYGLAPLDVSEATTFPSFDSLYTYDGDDLGAIYYSDHLEVNLWAPLASAVLLKIKKKGEQEFSLYSMKRTAHGVFRYSLKGDYELAVYRFLVTNCEATADSIDPYAKASTPNGLDSVVINPEKLKVDFHKEALPLLNSPVDAIIYEANVRDLTIDKHTDIVHKGTFKGLAEKGRKTAHGLPAGFDYVVSLGITHLQLQPLYDFKTVDELDPLASYNWGYDPAQYFVPEGSYASDVLDPYSRLKDLQEMVVAFHEKGIAIVSDVVFNHVYEYSSSSFERIVPNYYFRRRHDGKMATTSGCGDDLASERPMVRKLIIDACRYWITTFGIDGFRFDLMGIIDVETLNEIKKMAYALDSHFLLYGEGWNMGGEVNQPLGQMGNYRLLPDYAFFNDKYRDATKRWLLNEKDASPAFQYGYVSSSLDFYGKPMFSSAKQSLNYIECHDNGTVYDFIKSNEPDLDEADVLACCELGCATVLTSYGIPFIHMGQEIGQSKAGKDNTYNLPDRYNELSYPLLEEREDMYHYFQACVKFRRTMSFLHIYDPRVIDSVLDVNDVDGLFVATIKGANYAAPYEEVVLFYNPTSTKKNFELSSTQEIILNSSELNQAHLKVKSVSIPQHSLLVTALLGKSK